MARCYTEEISTRHFVRTLLQRIRQRPLLAMIDRKVLHVGFDPHRSSQGLSSPSSTAHVAALSSPFHFAALSHRAASAPQEDPTCHRDVRSNGPKTQFGVYGPYQGPLGRSLIDARTIPSFPVVQLLTGNTAAETPARSYPALDPWPSSSTYLCVLRRWITLIRTLL